MTAPSEATPDLDDLTRRVPGQALMAECVRRQAGRRPRGRFARILGAHAIAPEASPWFVGAMGERTTARMLDSLGPEYFVLHSLPVAESGADIDHLVVGPTGVVAITTKHHRDARVRVAGDVVLVNGRGEPWVPEARSERAQVVRTLATSTLPVAPVTSVVAVVESGGVTVEDAPHDVLVLDARRLVRTLRRMPHVLGHDAVWALAGTLSSAPTWTDEAAPEDHDVVARFGEIEREARIARVIRLAWAGGACAGLAGGAVVAASAVPGLMAMVSAATGS